MSKKKSVNSKILFTITLFFVLCCFMTTSAWAARKVELTAGTAQNYLSRLNQNQNFETTSLAEIFGLTADEKLNVLRSRTDFNRVTHYRYRQTYKDIPVWGEQIAIGINPSNEAVRLHGTIVRDIPGEVRNIPKNLDPLGALRDMEEKHKKKDKTAVWNFENEEYGTYIYIDKKEKANLCYVVSFYADNENGNPSRMVYIVDAKNDKVIDSFDNLQSADGTGPGGNLKIGYYYYGPTGDYPPFGVSAAGSTCTMNTTDVKTVDLNHGTTGTTAYSYTCYENTHEQINGAYCPLNDAQYFGQVIYDMYQDWYGTPVLPFQLMMRVHYSTNYENAFWNGSSMTFGDGYNTFHPLVCLDVSAHEVAHGFTDNHSDLIYSGQSGGINEAYSDMAGEAAEFYSRGTNDFMCGYDIFKAAGQALRYLYDPPLDGISIDHVDDYYSGMDVHYSSGIYNKAFYLIASSSGWDTRMAFDIFTKANMDYWTPSTTFASGATGVRDAALDYAYDCGAVKTAFAAVGITITCPVAPVANFSGTPTSGGAPLTVYFTDLSTNSPTSWSWNFGDSGTSSVRNPSHTYTSPGTYTVSLTAANSNGSDTETKTGYITVTAPQPPIADFSASSTNISVGDTVTFTDESLNTPTSWSWTFEGGSPASSTSRNPSVQYNTAGSFTVSLTATNAQGSDTETRTGYINVSTIPYCTSSANDQGYEYIARVVVGNLDNSSGASPYTDYTNMAANVTQGGTVSVSLTPGFTGSSYTEYWRIWIDYNGDHDFADSGEQVFSSSGSTTRTGTFTVPSSTITGDTRMRVSMSYSTYPPYCGTFTYGEVEDYTVNISGTGPQYTLTTNTVGSGSITLNPSGGTYPGGTVVTVTAVPAAGWQFDGWSGDLSGTANPTTITMNANKSVTANFSEVTGTAIVGIDTVLSLTTTTANRRAMPFTMPENGVISSVTMYHTGGGGSMILGVYDGTTSAPNNRLGVTASTTVSGSTGWQTINLTSPCYVAGGSTVWLAWVYQSNPGIWYGSGSPGRADAGVGWSGGMPDPFGSSTQANYLYCIYATYTPAGGPTYKNIGYTTVFGSTSTAANRRAQPFTMPENGTIESITMYHTGGSGNMILGVYDGASLPANRLAVTASTALSGSTGWQKIYLTSPVSVTSGTRIWLAWVYQSNPGIRYQTGTPGRAQSTATWSGGMPDPFGSSSTTSYIYSIYATYMVD